MLHRRAATGGSAAAPAGSAAPGSTSPEGGLRLAVDWIRCDGYGLCGDLAPEVIGLDEWRYPILPAGTVDRGHLNDVQRAIDCCPMKALRLLPASSDRRAG